MSQENRTPLRPASADASAAANDTTSRRTQAPFIGILRQAPTVLVFVVLIGVGLWGHFHEWTIPSFAELMGHPEADQTNWCDAHGVPEEICIACNSELMPKGKLYGWCREHGVAECTLEHPEMTQIETTRETTALLLDHAAHALALRPRKKNNSSCKLHLRRIQFANDEAVEKAGLDIRLAERAALVETVTANGEINYDPTRVARLATRSSGTVWRVEKNVGDQVWQGDLLALVDSVDVGLAKGELLQTRAELELANKAQKRLAQLNEIVPERRLQEVEAAQAKAQALVGKAVQMLINLGLPLSPADLENKSGKEMERLLQFLGIPTHMAAQLDPQRTTANLLPLIAPRDGVVVQRDLVAGEVVNPTRTLFTVVDTRNMWLTLDVPMEEAQFVRVGQKVVFRPDGYADSHTGTVTWISTEMHPETRTVAMRAELPNPTGRLLSETFGAGQIYLRETSDGVVVPREAVQWEGCCSIVFVRDRDFLQKDAYKVFHTRMVRPGVTQGDFTELIAGVYPGEVVVTKGSGVLRAELLKGNLGPG
jgi:multidrug efflux pump subunit AcrA (membrane-fusion protein)